MKQTDLIEAREQIQEDIISFIESSRFISHPEYIKDNVCDIVVDNFNYLIDNYLKSKWGVPRNISVEEKQKPTK